MGFGFPLFVDVRDNNCLILGGGTQAAERAAMLLQFGAKVTVIHPTLCEELRRLDAQGKIRYIPRRYFRGDCSNAHLCVAATESDTINIAISQECKAKKIPVNVVKPEIYGTFRFPNVVFTDEVVLSVSGKIGQEVTAALCTQLAKELPRLLREATETCQKEEAETGR